MIVGAGKGKSIAKKNCVKWSSQVNKARSMIKEEDEKAKQYICIYKKCEGRREKRETKRECTK